MNKPKFKYEQDQIVFFFQYRGVFVELLRARIKVASLEELQRLRSIAQQNLNEVMIELKRAA